MMQRIFTIALVTFREAIRSKLLYAAVAFVVMLVLVATPYARATIGEPILVVKDFGLAGASWGSVLYVVIAGGSFLQKELTRKTAYLLLARPLRRWEFIVGKFFGMTAMASTLLCLMIAALVGYCRLLEGVIDWKLLWFVPYGILELAIVSAAVLLFSTIVVTPVLNGLFALGFFVAGRSQAWLATFAADNGGLGWRMIMEVIPDLESLNISNGLIYGDVPPIDHVGWSLIYCGLYCTVLLGVAALVFERRDIP